MKYVLLSTLAGFLLCYGLAIATLHPDARPGVKVLHWATDINPARPIQINTFEATHPDVQVDPVPGDSTRLLIQCVTGVGPDMMDLERSQLRSLAEAGVLMDLTPLAKQGGFGLDQTYPAIRPDLMVGGRQYAFPCNVSVQAIIYNRHIFDDHHVPYPKPDWTWDEFIAAGRAILDHPSDSGQKHLAIVNSNPMRFLNDLMASHGARYFSADGRRCILDAPEAIAAVQQYYDLMYVHDIMPRPDQASAMSSQGGWGAGGINWFSNGEVAMLVIGRWYIVQLANYPEVKPYVAAVQMPHLPGRPACVVAGSRAIAVNARASHRDDIVNFLTYLASPQYAALIIKDGDALPPSSAAAPDGRALVNAAVPDMAFHQVYVDAITNAVTMDESPYIDDAIVTRWLDERKNQVENQVVSPAEAMRSVTREINQTIELNISRRKDLQSLSARR